MNVPKAIMHLFPQASPLSDFLVQDDSDGEGAYIAQWNMEEPQPTEAELQAAWDAMQPTLSDVKIAKIDVLNSLCNATILAGFTSDALGTANTYDFDYDAQINLGGMLNAITAGLVTASLVWKASGIPQSHTVDEFKAVFADGLTYKNAMIGHYWALKDAVNSATTAEEIEAIVWNPVT